LCHFLRFTQSSLCHKKKRRNLQSRAAVVVD